MFPPVNLDCIVYCSFHLHRLLMKFLGTKYSPTMIKLTLLNCVEKQDFMQRALDTIHRHFCFLFKPTSLYTLKRIVNYLVSLVFGVCWINLQPQTSARKTSGKGCEVELAIELVRDVIMLHATSVTN